MNSHENYRGSERVNSPEHYRSRTTNTNQSTVSVQHPGWELIKEMINNPKKGWNFAGLILVMIWIGLVAPIAALVALIKSPHAVTYAVVIGLCASVALGGYTFRQAARRSKRDD